MSSLCSRNLFFKNLSGWQKDFLFLVEVSKKLLLVCEAKGFGIFRYQVHCEIQDVLILKHHHYFFDISAQDQV